MTKPIHPIRKMQDASIRIWSETDRPIVDVLKRDRLSYARHVKPLLDALEESRSGLHAHCAGATADTIRRVDRLLAAWKEPIK